MLQNDQIQSLAKETAAVSFLKSHLKIARLSAIPPHCREGGESIASAEMPSVLGSASTVLISYLNPVHPSWSF